MGMKERIERHLRVLCEEIGPRPTGSQANLAAVEYACGEFERCGLEVRRQEFDCMDWSQSGGSLTVRGRETAVRCAPYSMSCDVRGELIRVQSLEELRTARIGGRIVLLCGALAAEPLMPKSFAFWNPEEHRETISLLEAGRPLAVLTASLSDGDFLPVIEDGDFELPCGIVLPESLPALTDGADAALELRTVRKPASAANVIASRGSGGRKVCFSAHIDTAAGTPGALDNASGVAVLLALAEKLKDRDCPCGIEFVLFNGEDYYSNPGETAYLADQLSRPEEYLCAYNVDGVGVKGRNLSYSFYGCGEELTVGLSRLAGTFSEMEEAEPWPQGDHMLFASSGVPAVAITSCGIFELVNGVLHTEKDTPELVDAGKLEILADLLLRSI